MNTEEEIKADKNGQIIEGTISISGKGMGYVRNKEMKDSVEVSHEHLNRALQGDMVKIRLLPEKENKPMQGEVLEIIMRSKAGFSGVLEQENGVYFLVPSDIKMYTDIIIPKDKLGGAKVGQKVFGIITDWPNPEKAPTGEITKVLGMPRENEAEMQAIALEKGFVSGFPEEVEKEANDLEKTNHVTPEEVKKRRDLRGITTFTIDPEDAKDFDDALSFQELPNNNFEIGIHIADVSHYVTPSSYLDKEAIKRGTSVYLVDRTIPMLPEAISNDLCSLKPDEDKLTMSAIFEMNKNGDVLKEWFGKTIIHSVKRFTYEGAQKVLDDKAGPYQYELETLNNIAKKLTAKRFEKGAISMEQEEVKFKLDPNGVPIEVYKKIRGDTNKLIEEFMLLANQRVAEFISKGNDKVFVYRIHDEPDKDRIADLINFLKKLGYPLKMQGDSVSSYSLNKLLESLEGKEEKDTIQTAVIRSMAKAIYSTKNIGHYGLAFEYYTHFTSPIRRYPDVVVHRLLQDFLHGKEISPEFSHEYDMISTYSSQREKEASEAERASIKYKQVEYMSMRIGQTYDGVITGVSEWGVFVEEKETKCEGMIRLKDLGDDYFELNEKEMAVVGQKTHKKFRIGDKLKIKVRDANLTKKVIDYVLV